MRSNTQPSNDSGYGRDGTYRNTYTIESEPLQGTGKPWVLEFPAGTVVTRLRRIK